MDAQPVLEKVASHPQHKSEPLASAADPAAVEAVPVTPTAAYDHYNSVRGARTSSRAAGGAPDYGRLLWGPDYQYSGTLDYVRSHANHMVRRVDAEDQREHYVVHKHVQDVRVYKRVSSSAAPAPAPSSARFSPASSFSSSRSSARVRAPSSSVGGTGEDDDWARVVGHFEFRAVTRVPGNLETIMAVLAPECGRDAYWLAANTQKNMRFTTVTHCERVAGPQSAPAPAARADGGGGPFPRWSLQYLLTKFIKHSRTMDVAFSEFAAMDPPPSASSSASTSSSKPHHRRGFVYRRSVDDRTLGDAELQRKLAAVSAVGTDASVAARAHERVDRFFLQDWLLDVRESDEPNVCKLVLTTRALFRGEDELLRRSMRIEFREFCTNYLVSARKLLAAQWTDLLGDRASTARLRQPSSPPSSRVCAVCSSPFSLLRKRHGCRSCASNVCAKCCAPKQPLSGSVSNAGLLGSDGARSSSSSYSRRKRECVLCAQFGPAATARDARASQSQRSTVSAGVRRAFDASMAPTSLSVTSAHPSDDEDEDDADDLVAPALFASSFVSGGASSRGGAVLLDDSSSLTRAADAAVHASSSASPPPQQRRHKFRTDSSDSTSSARSSPGIVLISEIETLSLAGGFRRIPSSGSSSSAGGFGSSMGPRSSSSARIKRPDRAVSEDNVLASRGAPARPLQPPAPAHAPDEDEEDEEVTTYSEDDLANFTLELAP